MQVSRRGFLKLGGASAVAVAGLTPALPALASDSQHKQWSQQTTSICPYCAVGCGMLVGVADGKVVNIEGDSEHPINQGALCTKGGTLSQLVNSPQRITKPAYRAPGATEWQEVEWDWALDEIARRVKKVRDEFWTERDKDGKVVRRVEALASVGSAALDNEECNLYSKALRSWGLVYVEHQARI